MLAATSNTSAAAAAAAAGATPTYSMQTAPTQALSGAALLAEAAKLLLAPRPSVLLQQPFGPLNAAIAAAAAAAAGAPMPGYPMMPMLNTQGQGFFPGALPMMGAPLSAPFFRPPSAANVPTVAPAPAAPTQAFHMPTALPFGPTPVAAPQSHDQLRCNICGKKARDRVALRRHERRHVQTRSFVCSFPQCGKQFPDRSALTRHERVHSGEKPFACDECGKCFNDATNCRRHERIHNSQRPLLCPVDKCGAKFARASQLEAHREEAHGARSRVGPQTAAQSAASASSASPSPKADKGAAAPAASPASSSPARNESDDSESAESVEDTVSSDAHS